MEENIKIIVLPEVRDYVNALSSSLLDGGYKLTKEYSDKYVDDLVDAIYKIPFMPTHNISPKYAHHFRRYGNNLQYVFWQRKNTTWYFFFEKQGNIILVRHISNNWTEGQYIR